MSLAQLAATREKYTIADILHMEEAGIFGPEDNFELIEGEIVPMNAKHALHELLKSEVGIALAIARPKHLQIGFETSIILTHDTLIEPDICVYPRQIASTDVRGADLILAIEIADSTLAYDRGRKAKICASNGVQELWVIDAVQRRSFIHTGPSMQGWASIIEHGPEFELTIKAVPGFALRLSEI